MRYVKEQPFHRIGCARFMFRYRARGRRGCAGSEGKVTYKLGLKGSVGSRCVGMEGKGFPNKVLSGVTIGHGEQRPLEEAAVSCWVQGEVIRRRPPQE